MVVPFTPHSAKYASATKIPGETRPRLNETREQNDVQKSRSHRSKNWRKEIAAPQADLREGWRIAVALGVEE